MTDSSDLTLTTFVPGTKAKASEVNANFTTLKTAISSRASINGDNTQTFSVADGTKDEHAVNFGQLEDLSENLVAKINKAGTKFCVKSGNTTNGNGNLFSYSVLRITPLIAGTYANLVIADYEGNQITISKTPSAIDLTGNSDGTYNIFINTSGELYILNNTIYKQPARPTMVVNDIWLNTSADPFTCIKYSGTSDTVFSDVPLGSVTISSGAITSITTFPFNQNGYNVTTNTSLSSNNPLSASISNLIMPNYTSGTSKSFSAVYQASTAGFLYIVSRFSGTFYISSGNPDSNSSYSWTALPINDFGDQGYRTSIFLPIPKSMYYKVIVANTSGSSLTFFPCLGS